MSGKGMGGETAKRLAPSSWPGVAVWAVILVVFVSHPWEATKFTTAAIWGAGRYVGYVAFADCEDQPPFGWVDVKECPAPALEVLEDGADLEVLEVPAPGDESGDEFGAVYGVELPSPERVKLWVGGLRERSSVLVLDEEGERRD